jgi:hypothetical protein
MNHPREHRLPPDLAGAWRQLTSGSQRLAVLPKMSDLGKAPPERFQSEESEPLLLSNVARPIVRSPLNSSA